MTMLKRIEDLTKEELLELKNEDVEKFIEIEAAYEGIVPVPDPGPAPEAPKIKPTVKAYQVGDLVFLDQGEAASVAAMSSLRTPDCDWSAGYTYKWLDISDSKGVKVVYFYSRDDVKSLKKELAAYKTQKENYDKLASDYSTYERTLEKIREQVWAPVHDARAEAERINSARKVYENHLTLAEGNEDIAANFFRKAYQHQPEIIEAVLGEQPQPEPANDDPQPEPATA